jgi:hypothetical protein
MKTSHFLWVSFFCISLVSCVSLKPDSFRSFETSVVLAQKGLETEMSRDVGWTREADVDALARLKDAPLSDHMLKETKGYTWTTKVTVPHWDARLTLRALEAMNTAFLNYTKLLVQVTVHDPGVEKETQALAEVLNQNLRDFGGLIDSGKTQNNLYPAGVSALTSEGLLKLGTHSRAKEIGAAVRESQSWVDEYAAHCLRLIDLIRTDLKTAYGDRMSAIHDRWDDKRTPGRNTLARSIYNLNAEYADAMEALKALSLFYNGLPAAHQDLADGLGRKAKPQQALAQLATFAERVARLTKELEKAR